MRLLLAATSLIVNVQALRRGSGLFNMNLFGGLGSSKKTGSPTPASPIISSASIPTWDDISSRARSTDTGKRMEADSALREKGDGTPHTDAKRRMFGTTEEPRVLYYRDTAAWCPYCQKVWILLEEKKIPYEVEKINMRSYGDKPAEYLKMVPNGLLPAMRLDGEFMTDSLRIMLTLEGTFTGPQYKRMWPEEGTPEFARAQSLMRLERSIFGLWCNLVFRGALGNGPRRAFEEGLDEVNKELTVTSGPWFLNDLSIVDLTYITHVERMCASVAYWSGFKVRGDGRWPAIERWMGAFEALPSYMATKSDYYTHVMDIPPQYGPGYPLPGSEANAGRINGRDGSWRLPLPPLSMADLEPYGPHIDPGDESARHEAALKIVRNHQNIVKFALRGAGAPGAKRFDAPLADPYAVPAVEYTDDMDALLRMVVHGLLNGYEAVGKVPVEAGSKGSATSKDLIKSLAYFRDRIGVPRDMSYPAARQLRAHLNWVADQL